MGRFALARGARRQRKAWGWSEASRAEPQDSLNTKVAAREVGDSLFIISYLRRLRYRTLRALDFHNGRQPGVPLRSTPGFTLSPRSAG